MEWSRAPYLISDDSAALDFEAVCSLLQSTYWAENRSREAIRTAIRNSVCLGVYWEGKQIGFARAVTDRATFTWICDVVMAPEQRGRGLGKWLMECLLAHPELQTTTHLLATRDAHSLYESFGFARVEALRRGAPAPYLRMITDGTSGTSGR